jgi:glycolate oxidase
MNYGTVNAEHLQQFKQIVGEQFVFADEETLNHYGHDETEQILYSPQAVIKLAAQKR